jgi:hypothetical protein
MFMTRNLLATAVLAAAGLFSTGIAAAQTQNIPSGTKIDVRTDETIDIQERIDGRVYTGTIAEEVRGQNGNVVIPRGSRAELVARRLGRNELSIDLDSVTVNGQRYSVDATTIGKESKQGVGANERTGKYVGGGALLGTLLGAIAGGGKGAAIGAAAGAGVGAGAQTITRGNAVHVPAETVLSFRLDQALNVTPDNGYDRDGHHYHRFDDSNNEYGDRNYYDDGRGQNDRRQNDRRDTRRPRN